MLYLNDFSWICISVITFLSLLSTKTERALIGFSFAPKVINYTLWKAWGEKTGYSEHEAIIALREIFIGLQEKIRRWFVSISLYVVYNIAFFILFWYGNEKLDLLSYNRRIFKPCTMWVIRNILLLIHSIVWGNNWEIRYWKTVSSNAISFLTTSEKS